MIRSSNSTTATLPAAGGAPGAGRGVEAFIAGRQAGWEELVALLGRSGGRLEALGADDGLRLAELYRSTAADLARARQRWPGDPVVGELEALVGRGRAVVYRAPTTRASLLHWLTTGFFQRVRERPGALLVATLLFWGPIVGTAVWAHGDPAAATRLARVSALSSGAADSAGQGGDGSDRGFSSGQSASFSSQIFTNNIRVSFLAFALGLAGGIGTAAVLLFNGVVIGLIVGLFVVNGATDVAISFLAPHGVLELSLITVAGAAGLRMGWALVAPGLRSRADALRTEARAAGEVALGVALWLVPTGLIEGFVTPRALPPSIALAVGLTAAGVFWALVWWRGRPDPPTVAPA